MNIEHEEQLAVLRNENAHINKDIEELKETQKTILAELNRYKGAFGMVFLLFSAIGTAITIYFKFKVN
jgi:hypothetical protein